MNLVVRIAIFIISYISCIYTFNNDSSISEEITYKYKLCGVTKVRNNAKLIPQWIEYHLSMGFSQIFITNDCSEDDGRTVFWAKFYEKLGFVYFLEKQHFNHCDDHKPNENKLLRYMFPRVQKACEWILVFDPDEYVFPTHDNINNVEGYITKILNNFKYPIMYLQWQNAFSAGHEKAPNGLIIDNYLDGEWVDFKHIIHGIPITGKHLAINSEIKNWTHQHAPKMINDMYEHFPPVGTILASTEDCNTPSPPLFLRHYYYLSYEDVLAGRANRSHDAGNQENPWFIDPRKMWLRGNRTSNCPIVSDIFRQLASAHVKNAIQERLDDHYSLLGQTRHPLAIKSFLSGNILPYD